MSDHDVHYTALAVLNLPAQWQTAVAIRPRRRSIGIQVTPQGTVVVLVPPATDPKRVVSVVARHLAWISTTVKQAVRTAQDLVVKTWTDGETFILLGSPYQLRLTNSGPAARISEADSHVMLVRRDQPPAMRRAIIALYCATGLKWAQHNGEPYEQQARIHGLRYEVRDLGRRRWGIYQPGKHLITLHWPLFGLPLATIEYVLVHELAHAIRPPGRPHGPAWERQFSQLMPDWRQRRAQLIDAARFAWMGG